jgi:hypothetical protein
VVNALLKKIAAQEDRIAGLEKTAAVYGGTFNRAVEYKRNNIVSHKGTLFIACCDTIGAQPGESNDWVLMHKIPQPLTPSRGAQQLVGKT